jgi:inorganic pyrophosphatase
MLDYENAFTLGETNEFIYTVCEVPKGSTLKIEYDRVKKIFMIDRVEPKIFAKPCSYGFIPQTTDEDGDPLDTLIITEEPIAELSDSYKNQIEHHFNHYKDLKKPGSTVVRGWGDTVEAWKIIQDCANRYKPN